MEIVIESIAKGFLTGIGTGLGKILIDKLKGNNKKTSEE